MKKSKFFYFTISGDDFDPLELKSQINITSDIFYKGNKQIVSYLNNREIIQNTNRWVYTSVDESEEGISRFFTRNLQLLVSNLEILSKYIHKFTSKLELVIYAGNETDIDIEIEQIELILKIGVKLSISFC